MGFSRSMLRLWRLNWSAMVVLPVVGWLQTRRHLADILNELQRHFDLRPV